MKMPEWDRAADTVDAAMTAWPIDQPGGVVLGFDHTGIRFVRHRGLANMSTQTAFDEHTVTRWASVTKHVFAALAIETGLLDLGAPLGQYLPELSAAPAGVTLGQALSMQGGLPDNREILTLLGYDTTTSTDAAPLLALAARIDALNFTPGTEVSYSNTGYRLAEVALRRSGAEFADLVAGRAQALGIGMRASEYWVDPVPKLSPGYRRTQEGAWKEGFQGMHLSAAGSLSGSAMDLAIWLADLMARPVFQTIARPVPLQDGRPTGYGMGLKYSQIAGGQFAGHGGSQPGYRADFTLIPELNGGIVALTNREDLAPHALTTAAVASLFGGQDGRAAANGWAPCGLYATRDGNLWADVRPSSVIVRDVEEPLFQASGGRVISLSAQHRIDLTYENGVLLGEIGHVQCRLEPICANTAPPPEGRWEWEGATFVIADGKIHWGIGAQRVVSILQPLGGQRWLFRLRDGRRICMRDLGQGRMELSLARARCAIYRYIGAN